MSSEMTTKDELEEMMSLIRAKHKNLSDVEIQHLYHLAKNYGLDPNKNEIWAVKYGNSPATIFVGRDGLLGIAHKSNQLDGLTTKVIVLTKDGNVQETDIAYPGTKLIGAKCTVYRKDMSHDITVSVKFDEYNSNKSNWQTMPETMIKKVAEAHALRRAFSIHGVYIPEEFDQAEKNYTVKDAKKPEKKKISELDETIQEKIREPLLNMINELAELTDSNVEAIIKEDLSGKNIGDLYQDEARLVYKALSAKIKELKK